MPIVSGPSAKRIQPGKLNAEINVTPLVDVMLVLLIIMMVITPMLQTGPAVVLPKTTDPPQKPEDKNQVLVAVTSDKSYRIGKDKTALNDDSLKARMAEEYERNAKAPVLIKADARLQWGDVKKAMQIVKDAQFESVGLIAEKQRR